MKRQKQLHYKWSITNVNEIHCIIFLHNKIEVSLVQLLFLIISGFNFNQFFQYNHGHIILLFFGTMSTLGQSLLNVLSVAIIFMHLIFIFIWKSETFESWTHTWNPRIRGIGGYSLQFQDADWVITTHTGIPRSTLKSEDSHWNTRIYI